MSSNSFKSTWTKKRSKDDRAAVARQVKKPNRCPENLPSTDTLIAELPAVSECPEYNRLLKLK